MKQCYLVVFLAGLSLIGSYAHATTHKNVQVKDSKIKLYVKKDMIKVSQHAFAIVTKDGMFTARALRRDTRGVYVTLQDIGCEKGQPRYWKCRECGKIVEGIKGIKNHKANYGERHRFFYPYNLDFPDD